MEALLLLLSAAFVGLAYGDECFYSDGTVLSCYSCCEYDCCEGGYYGIYGGIGGFIFLVILIVSCLCVRRRRQIILSRVPCNPNAVVVQTHNVNPLHAGYVQQAPAPMVAPPSYPAATNAPPTDKTAPPPYAAM